MPAAVPSDMEVAKVRFWCPWLPLMCRPGLRAPSRPIPRGAPVFPNSHEKHPPCRASERETMSLGAVNSTEGCFLMILLGPGFLLLQPHELPGQMSAESPSHHSVALPMLLPSHRAWGCPWGARSLPGPGAVRNSPFLWEGRGRMNVPVLHMNPGAPQAAGLALGSFSMDGNWLLLAVCPLAGVSGVQQVLAPISVVG